MRKPVIAAVLVALCVVIAVAMLGSLVIPAVYAGL